MFWTEILTALALVLIIEGMVPFVGPAKYRQIVAQMAQLSDNHLRTVGLVIMIAGLLLLFIVRG
ncbi:MAG: DUF2065 domain-containing protein [Woeseiaceae bacterium]|nr:DUF2065 domain-containing protein [Woeseiaceae bacterium]